MKLAYKISYSIDNAEIGVYPQIQEFSRNHPNFPLYHYPNELGRFETNIEFPVYRMESKAILTDLIDNVPLAFPLMISDRCLEVFKSRKLPAHQVFPLKFIYKGKLVSTYSFFNIVRSPDFIEKYISWKHSKFYKTSDYHRVIHKEMQFNSLDELKAMRHKVENEEHLGFKAEPKIIYSEDYGIMNFGTYPLYFGYFCTEDMKEAILQAGLTGFRFIESPKGLFVEE